MNEYNNTDKILREMIEVEGVSTAVTYRKRKDPVILGIHGSGLSQETFSSLLDDSRFEKFSFVFYDLPGHGKSGKPARPEEIYSYPGYVRHLVALIKKLELTEYIIMGHSLGGHIALQGAVSPGLPGISGLLLLGAAPLSGMEDLFAAFQPPSESAPSPSVSLPEEQARYLASLFDRRKDAQIKLKKIILSADPESKTLFMQNFGVHGIKDEVKWIKKSRLPIWMVIGEDDPVINPQYLKNPSIQELLGECKKLKWIAEKDHMPIWDESEGHASELLLFLESNSFSIRDSD